MAAKRTMDQTSQFARYLSGEGATLKRTRPPIFVSTQFLLRIEFDVPFKETRAKRKVRASIACERYCRKPANFAWALGRKQQEGVTHDTRIDGGNKRSIIEIRPAALGR